MGRLIYLGGAALCLCAASQFPEFSQQYVQRLGGAVDELQQVADDFDASAAAAGVSRQQALASMTGSVFQDRRRGDMLRLFARLDRLDKHYQALREADALTRVGAIARFDDSRIASRVWDDFQPAVPLTRDGLVFAVFGFVAGFLALSGLGWSGHRLRRRIWPEQDIFAEGSRP